ncbi:mitochondrial F1F0 ATP synthase associated 36.3 kDa protein [Dunaliella salina]|uniref:Mitochondrial F1F0 ATP synthase associated 36.3 kDa protein n=1 Tax=Dunaliella salina TaxID=3046 RepID=A0ABQ7GZD9_DUNSA|nr:mitochondrial F1F0 ATP synthase associated 36.3 kDa protein [Dunaliella salina]|eukprot:KAF5839974.1 mitochondrial F1F0 ATP synthase associated 36.3 kDa protein [Dunaliella salina]
MRRACQLALRQGLASPLATNEAVQAMGAATQGARQMSGPSHETPLTKIMPPLVALPRQVLSTAFGLTGQLVSGTASSGQAKGVVSSFADGVLLKEQFVKLTELDVSYWAYWLSTCGYSSQAGFKRLAEAAVAKVPSMEAQQVADLVVGFHKAGCYDKMLFDAVTVHVAQNFVQYETEQLLKMLDAFASLGHYSRELFDDIGDSITYANNYLAPVRAPTNEVCSALAAYAKFNHERADVFVTLARGISEVGLSKLSKEQRSTAVVDALTAFKRFSCYPEQVDALLYYTETESFQADEAFTRSTCAKVFGDKFPKTFAQVLQL